MPVHTPGATSSQVISKGLALASWQHIRATSNKAHIEAERFIRNLLT
jgi:hypothetical protein